MVSVAPVGRTEAEGRRRVKHLDGLGALTFSLFFSVVLFVNYHFQERQWVEPGIVKMDCSYRGFSATVCGDGSAIVN
jgi:hypothetical protein